MRKKEIKNLMRKEGDVMCWHEETISVNNRDYIEIRVQRMDSFCMKLILFYFKKDAHLNGISKGCSRDILALFL